jgi:hypothetical protein
VIYIRAWSNEVYEDPRKTLSAENTRYKVPGQHEADVRPDFMKSDQWPDSRRPGHCFTVPCAARHQDPLLRLILLKNDKFRSTKMQFDV